MHKTVFNTLTALAFIAISGVNAQTPAYLGELLLQPGLSGGKCLTAQSNSDGAKVVITPCVNGAGQRWLFQNGQIKVFGNKCLDVTEGVNKDGTKMQIWTCYAGSANQAWDYNKWTNKVTWLNKGKCLDLTDGSLADNNPAQIWGCNGGNINQVWNAGYDVNALPQTSQPEQYGTNRCTDNSQNSNCQTAWINSATDFCLWAPPWLATVGDSERRAITYCTKSGRGARVIPNGSLRGVHFVKTPEYVQVTGTGDLTSLNIPRGDSGGEIDNRGADGWGNPRGGLVFGNSFGPNQQYHEWTTFISDREFCFRACVGARATQLCNHIYDIMGCWWNMPANYNAGQYENCQGNAAIPMGVYGTSTWYQGVSPTPAAHPAPASSNCQALPTVSVSPLNAQLRRQAQLEQDRVAKRDEMAKREQELRARQDEVMKKREALYAKRDALREAFKAKRALA